MLEENSEIGKDNFLKKTRTLKEGLEEKSFASSRNALITYDSHFAPAVECGSLAFAEGTTLDKEAKGIKRQ